jgi:Family of unknown function (DUF5681)
MTTSSESNAACGEAGAEPHKKDYEVGYGRPPKEHRFQPGNKANPNGRKKKTRNGKVVIRDLLLEPITVREGGEVKEIPALEAVIKKMRSQALGGDHKAILTIIGLAQRDGILTPDQEETVETLSDTDKAIIDDVVKRLRGAAANDGMAPPAEEAQPDAA